jgi:hypothetical protein
MMATGICTGAIAVSPTNRYPVFLSPLRASTLSIFTEFIDSSSVESGLREFTGFGLKCDLILRYQTSARKIVMRKLCEDLLCATGPRALNIAIPIIPHMETIFFSEALRPRPEPLLN